MPNDAEKDEDGGLYSVPESEPTFDLPDEDVPDYDTGVGAGGGMSASGHGDGSGHGHRLAFDSPTRAEAEAARLGLADVHRHQRDGQTLWMPGRTHQELNEALRAAGKEPVSKPGK